MIEFKHKFKVDDGCYIDMYTSPLYDIDVTYMDGPINMINVKWNKMWLPTIRVDIFTGELQIYIVPNGYLIDESKREKHEKAYEDAKNFIDTELRPFLQDLLDK